jgi:hypothetical protein
MRYWVLTPLFWLENIALGDWQQPEATAFSMCSDNSKGRSICNGGIA